MELSTWNPELLMDMQRAVFNNSSFLNYESMEMAGFLAADIIQTNYGYCLYADVPGMTYHDINLSIDNGVMTLSGDRKITYDNAGSEEPILNRFRGKFCMQFNLSDRINYHRVSATVSNGVLKVEMPVSDKENPNKIQVPVKKSSKS